MNFDQFDEEDRQMLELCHGIMVEAHTGQSRRGGVPYEKHPEEVAHILMYRGYEPMLIAIGLLHDVIEDNKAFTREVLLARGVPVPVVDVVVILTKLEDEEYEAFIRRIIDDMWARIVKAADICANLTDSPSASQVQKYTTALITLAEV